MPAVTVVGHRNERTHACLTVFVNEHINFLLHYTALLNCDGSLFL